MEIKKATYVKTAEGEWAVQHPDDSQWGFALSQADDEGSQSWPGGFGLAEEWEAVPLESVPQEVRDEMDWLLE